MFRDAQHPLTGERLFDNVFSTGQRFDCDPIERMFPDVVAIPAVGFQTRSRFDHRRQLMRGDPSLTGTHRREGVLMVQAAGLVTGQRYVAQLRDVAPTILRLLGLPAPDSMTGCALVGIQTPIGPRRSVSTPQPAEAPAESCVTPAQQAVVEQRLRQLGYLE